MPRDGGWQKHFGKLCIAATGLCTVAAHYLINTTNKGTVRDEIDKVVSEKLDGVTTRSYEQRLVREREFVRKEDLEKIARDITRRLDETGDKMDDLAERTSHLEGYLKAKDRKMSEETVTFWRRAYRRNR